MRFSTLTKPIIVGSSFLETSGRAIEALGTEQFGNQMVSIAHDVVSCNQVSAFTIEPNTAPRMLLEADYANRTDVRQVAEKYTSTFWRHDPVVILESSHCTDGLYVSEIEVDDIELLSYRRECYHHFDFSSRLSLYRSSKNRGVRVSFYCERPFTNTQRNAVYSAADLIIALVITHDALSMQGRLESQRSKEAAIDERQLLSRREREVCDLIAAGHTSEAIALILGIKFNSVLTYRKRAYSKLQISSQNELFKLLSRKP